MESITATKSYAFAIKIITLYKFLIEQKKEFTLSRQLLRSGTAIGALVRESNHAESKADFLHKINIALKEANETEYWLMLLRDTGYISFEDYDDIQKHCNEIIRLLASSVKTTKKNLGRNTV
ncbi:four helix bundle protein [Haoranjiania flava]|uniref:Four helix bundle protein n=1 Tax=Haoranjiania flava TaxID=1856322 RepID=A0AAE3IMP0_9BACT|nr:four helix bundle protein [Haoranjiania flava]MCU7694719.1 four helix bundle protein [Haoranjiania flava]